SALVTASPPPPLLLSIFLLLALGFPSFLSLTLLLLSEDIFSIIQLQSIHNHEFPTTAINHSTPISTSPNPNSNNPQQPIKEINGEDSTNLKADPQEQSATQSSDTK